MTAPANITELHAGEVFVFGSHMSGHHGGGAARFAVEMFGAVVGRGEGMQGASYAIPTMGTLPELAVAVSRFLFFAATHRQLTFLVTPIGTGIAGIPAATVAPMFADCPPNVSLPAEFESALSNNQ